MRIKEWLQKKWEIIAEYLREKLRVSHVNDLKRVNNDLSASLQASRAEVDEIIESIRTRLNKRIDTEGYFLSSELKKLSDEFDKIGRIKGEYVVHLQKQISQLDKEIYRLRGHLLEVTTYLLGYTRAHTLDVRENLLNSLEKINGHIQSEQNKDQPGMVTYEN